MYNVKLKSVPNKAKTGSQLDYSLVDRNTLFLKPNTPVDSDVKNTIGAVSRDKANIEAEGGETIIGDTNNDGFLEHQTIVGKRHTQGGVPLNVPEGSFIFSDTKKMTIKDPEVLAIFGMKPSKAGYTPAEIAKKYNINEFIAILKDPAKDKYSKETAQIMLQSNLKKLGMLALIQESMKGFPDGVPAIAESIMGQMQGGQGQESPEQESQEAPQEQGPQEEMQEGEQPMQRYGGTQLPKAQFGNPISATPTWSNTFNPPSYTQIKNKHVANQIASEKEKQRKEEEKAAKKLARQKASEPVVNPEDGYTGYWNRVGHNFGKVLGVGDVEKGSWTKHNDPRMQIAAYKMNPFSSYYDGEGFWGGAMDYLGNLASMPQKEMNHIMTGLYETPMTTSSRYHKHSYGTRLIGDIVTDPLIMDFAVKAAAKKAIPYGVNAAKYVTEASIQGAKYLGTKLAPIIGTIAKKIEPAIKYTKEVWDKIPIEKKILILEKISQGSTHFESAHQKPISQKELNNIQNEIETEHKKAISKKQQVPDLDSLSLSAPAPLTSSVPTQNTTPVQQTINYYNPRLPKPQDTETIKWLPAQNSAELNGTANGKTSAVVDASEKAAAVRNVGTTAQQTADEINKQNQAVQNTSTTNNGSQPTYKIKIKSAPNPPVDEIPVERTEPGYKYGGNIHQYQSGATTTEPQTTTTQQPNSSGKKVVTYIVGTRPDNKGKIYAKYDDGTISENDITKYMKWDPNTLNKQGKRGVIRLELPQSLSFKEKQRLANVISQTGFGDKNVHILQSSSAHINPKDYYPGYSGGLTPQDFEDKLVRENFGDDETDKMSEVTKRREAFKILGIKADESELGDAKKLYNPNFIHNTFYPAFKKLLPNDKLSPAGDKYRQLGDDENFALDHLDAYKVPKPILPPGKKLAYQCVNGQVTSLEYEGDALPAGSFATSEEAGKDCGKIANVNKPRIAPFSRNNDWWLQDRINLAGALTDRAYTYFPAMGHHDYMTPGYILNDPTTQLRAVQQSINSLQNQGFNSMSGNTAMAAASGLTGQGIDKSAEILGNVGNSNVGVVNNLAVNNANTINRGIDMNEADKEKYMADFSRALNNHDKEESFLKWRRLNAINNGITNSQTKNQYEQIYKNVTIDPITGRRMIHGNDTALLNDDGSFAYDTYVNPYTSGTAAIDTDFLIDHYMKNKSMGLEEAKARAELQLKAQQIRSSGSRGRLEAQYPGGSYGQQSSYYGGGYGTSADSAYGFGV